jgi:hypothetical protein
MIVFAEKMAKSAGFVFFMFCPTYFEFLVVNPVCFAHFIFLP